MSKTTPGPWIAIGNEVRQPAGRMVAYTGPHHTPEAEYPLSCKLQDEANAAHIVACVNAHDDLLEALQWSLQHSPYQGESEETDFLRFARAAIAKATGERQ